MFYLWLYLRTWWSARHKEEGIETIEWIALAAVVLALLMGMLTLMTPFGKATAALIFGQIAKWIGRW